MKAEEFSSRIIVHICISEELWGVEKYVLATARSQVKSGSRVYIIGNRKLEEAFEPGIKISDSGFLISLIRIWRLRPTVIHTHMTYSEFIGLILAKATGARLVTTRHFARKRGKGIPGKLFSVVFNRFCATQIAISKCVQESIEFPSAVVVYPGLDASDRNSELTSRTALMLQRLSPEKKTEDGLLLWSNSKVGQKGWKLLIAGDGSERQRLEEMARKLGIYESTVFVGRVKNVEEIMLTSSILIATCPTEAFGFSILEGMSIGLPVIAPNTTATHELLGEEYPSFKVTFEDCVNSSQALISLTENHSYRVEYGKYLKRRQTEIFSVSNYTLIENSY